MRRVALLPLLLAGCAVALSPTDLSLTLLELSTNAVNVDSAAATVTCDMTITTTGDAVLDATCQIVSPLGTRVSCVAHSHTANVWGCDLEVPQNAEAGTWVVEYITARDTTLERGAVVTHADLEADIPNVIPNEAAIDIVVTSTTPDITGPTFDAFAATPSTISTAGGTVTCASTVRDSTGVEVSGCTAISPSAASGQDIACSDTTGAGGTGDEYSCDVAIPAADTEGTWVIQSWARDVRGNRTADATASSFLYGDTDTWTRLNCAVSSTITNRPLAVEVDDTGKAYVLGETSQGAQSIPYALSGGACDVAGGPNLFANGSASFPYWRNDTASRISALGESVVVDNVAGVVYYSHGGEHLGTAGLNHSRVVRYDPVLDEDQNYNLPGNRNEIVGLHWDATRGLLWVAEAGFNKVLGAGGYGGDGGGGDETGTGTIVAFDPDNSELWDNTWTFETETPPNRLLNLLCSGAEDPTTTACFKRYELTAGVDKWTAHLQADPSGDIWFTNFWGTSVGKLDPGTETSVTFPLRPAQAASFVGTGPWEIMLSPDNTYMYFNEYGSHFLNRMPVASGDDPACQSLVYDGLDDVSTNGLVVHYDFNTDECSGGIQDLSGNGHHGTCTSSTEPTFWNNGHGPGNSAYLFDGVNDSISIGTDAEFDISGDMTISAWVYVLTAAHAASQPVFTKGDGTYGIKRIGSGEFGFVMYPGPTSLESATDTDNFWYHITGVYDVSETTMSLYVDGEFDSSTTQASLSVDNALALTVGSNVTSGLYLEGGVDDVRLYDRVLTETEIRGLAAIGHNPCVEKVDLNVNTSGTVSEQHSFMFAPDGKVWFTLSRDEPSSDPFSSTIGYVDADFTRAVLIDQADVDPSLNPASNEQYNGIAIDQNTGDIWIADMEGDQYIRLIKDGTGGAGGAP